MSQRKILTVFFYTLLVLFIGRNLTFLPTWHGLAKEKNYGEMLKQQTEKLLSEKPGTYSVYYKNLTRDESFTIDAEMIHTGASVNKLPIVITAYQLEEDGKLDLDEQVTIQENDIQDYGTGTIRYEEPGGTYSLRTLARLALKQSDNTAAHVLTNIIGESVIQDHLTDLELHQTNMVKNKTSVKDMGILFEKIYKGEILNAAHTKEVLGFLTDTDIEDRLPFKLTDARVYHKTGDAVGSLHDVGIIEQPDGNVYYLGVMTSDIGDTETETKETIAEIAKMVSDFLHENS